MKNKKYNLIIISIIVVLFFSWKLYLTNHDYTSSVDNVFINISENGNQILSNITVTECEVRFPSYDYYIKDSKNEYYYLSTSNLNIDEKKDLLDKINMKKEQLIINTLRTNNQIKVTTNGKEERYTYLELVNYTFENKK